MASLLSRDVWYSHRILSKPPVVSLRVACVHCPPRLAVSICIAHVSFVVQQSVLLRVAPVPARLTHLIATRYLLPVFCGICEFRRNHVLSIRIARVYASRFLSVSFRIARVSLAPVLYVSIRIAPVSAQGDHCVSFGVAHVHQASIAPQRSV